MYLDRRVHPEMDRGRYTTEPRLEPDVASISGTASLAYHGILLIAVQEAVIVSSVPSRGPNPSILIPRNPPIHRQFSPESIIDENAFRRIARTGPARHSRLMRVG